MKLIDIPIINRLYNYSWGAFLNKLLVFLLLPLISHALAPEEFAVYSILLLFAALASHLFQLGLHQSLMTLYYQQPDESSKLSLISTTWRTVGVNSTFFLALVIIFKNALSQLLINSRQDYSNLLVLTALMIFFDVFVGLTQVLLNIRQESRQYAILSLTKNLIILAGVVLSSILGILDIVVFFVVITLGSMISFFHSMYFMKHIWQKLSITAQNYLPFSTEIFKTILRFGIFMVPATFAVISLQSADRYMLNLLSARTLYDAGIYAIGYKIGMIMSLFTVVFDLLFFPYIMQLADQPYVKRQLRRLFTFYIFSGTLVAVVIILFSREVFLIIDSSYQEGAGLVFFGVISMFLRGLSNILVLGFYILKRSESIAVASVLAALINILLNWLWIPHYGILGAGFASIFAYLFIIVYNFISVEKAFKSGYNPVWIFLSLTAMIAVSWFNYFYTHLSAALFIGKFIFTIVLLFTSFIFIKKKGFIDQFLKRIK